MSNENNTAVFGTFSQQCKLLYCADEAKLSKALYRSHNSIPQANKIQLTEINRQIQQQHDWFLDILQQYKLNSKEGMLLMSLAEALIRIPDQQGTQALFHDRLHRGAWLKKDAKNTLLAKALQWLGNQAPIDYSAHDSLFQKITQQGAIEVCTLFIEQMSQRFVFAENLDDALLRSRKLEPHEACSFDMLGEAALTHEEAENYFEQYQQAIIQVGHYNECLKDIPHEVSIKLSALHPNYQPEKFELLKQQLLPKLIQLCDLAQRYNVLLTLDAEEQYRLELSLKLLTELLIRTQTQTHQFSPHPNFKLNNIGIAVQAYGKRGLAVIDELKRLSIQSHCQITVRLVKGAYWDFEIKSAQQLGLTDYPVWSHKQLTDDYFLMCAQALLTPGEHNLLAQFASHNPETLLQIQKLYDNNSEAKKQPLKLQRLHGMGEVQHAYMAENFTSQTRVYCPIGVRNKLLPYLVRRLIENGANTSFLYPQEASNSNQINQHRKIKKPSNIFDYRNSESTDIRQDHNFNPLYAKVKQVQSRYYNQDKIAIKFADKSAIQHIAQVAYVGFHTLPKPIKRAACLNVWADKILQQQDDLIALLVLQAGKTYQDAIDEVREACDFCRYYASQATQLFNTDNQRPSITGELNQLHYKGKGIAVCISPWNFPLAIFVGQIAAAWVAGNSVIAKPAQQTLSIAQYALNLAFESEIDSDQIQLLHCQGRDLLPSLLEQNSVQLVCFTGSTRTAKSIQHTLATYPGAIIPFIAETGGQNVLIADSSALLDQLIPDIIQSAFHSAGQRCSALRVAFIQQDIFSEFCASLQGQMQTLTIADPSERETDIGPIIDIDAVSKLQQHIKWLDTHAKLIARSSVETSSDTELAKRLFPPCAYQIESISQIKEENFGPILHVIPFAHNEVQQILADINHTGYGLTMGLHSRNQDWLDHIIRQVNVGNIYINRNMVGAKVSSQPFGGHGLSGTGPKAGGPNYLNAMVDEYMVTTNITAWGGNPELL